MAPGRRLTGRLMPHVTRLKPQGSGLVPPSPTLGRRADDSYPSAATTFEKTFAIWFPIVKRTTMTTIETSTRIKAYSTIPWPAWPGRSAAFGPTRITLGRASLIK
jgi:hypothetical protein